jgi:hypothetical protein
VSLTVPSAGTFKEMFKEPTVDAPEGCRTIVAIIWVICAAAPALSR